MQKRSLVVALFALANASAQQFQERAWQHLPFDAALVAAGDVDGDGDLDLMGRHGWPPSGTLLLNEGHARFVEAPPGHLPPTLGLVRAKFADVDGDGDQDLILANGYNPPFPEQNQLFENDGSGRFTDVSVRLPSYTDVTTSVVAEDLDGDGDVDLVFGNLRIGPTGGQDRLYRNDGRGFFTDATAALLPVALEHTGSLSAGDVDGDGDVDLVCGSSSSGGRNRLYLNTGAGVFIEPVGFLPAGRGYTSGLALGDVDGDRDPDLVVADRNTTELYVNDGMGRFVDETATRLPPDGGSWYPVLRDFDGDGDLDLAVGADPDRVYKNDGTGVFMRIASALGRGSLLAADFDLDADDDLAGSGLYLNDGSAQFLAVYEPPPLAAPYGTEIVDVELGDLDGDGDLDAVAASVGRWSLFRNDGDGCFLRTNHWNGGHAVELGDVDGDGDLDLVFAFGQLKALHVNDGTGGFVLSWNRFPATPYSSYELALGDVDGDGDLDAVFPAGGYGDVHQLFLNDGSGTFVEATSSHLPPQTGQSSTPATSLADIDGDGDLDLIFATATYQKLLYSNDGTGRFTDVTATNLPQSFEYTLSVAVGDVDGDGDLDLVWGNVPGSYAGAQQNTLYLNDGRGVFTDATAGRMPTTNVETVDIGLADVDGDGDLDLVCANGQWTYQNNLALNDGAGRFTEVTATRLPQALDDTRALALGDVDGDRDVDIVFGGEEPLRLYFNGLQQLRSRWAAAHGTPWVLDVQLRPGFATAVNAGVVFIATAPARIPVPPYGIFGLAPAVTVMLPGVNLLPPSGTASVTIPIPNAAALIGRQLFAQGLVADRYSSPRLTNRVSEVIW